MLTQKSAVLAAGLVTLFAGSAYAADLPYVAAQNVNISTRDAGQALVASTFSGFYAGGNLNMSTSDSFDFDEDTSKFGVGLQAGYLEQFGMFVIGGEIEANWTDQLQYVLTPGAGVTQDWSIAAKARAGVALDQTLVYGTLGYGAAKLEGFGGASTEDEWNGGLVFGGGVEQAFGAVSVRAEYLQSRYDSVATTFAGSAFESDLVNHTFSLGANYRF